MVIVTKGAITFDVSEADNASSIIERKCQEAAWVVKILPYLIIHAQLLYIKILILNYNIFYIRKYV